MTAEAEVRRMLRDRLPVEEGAKRQDGRHVVYRDSKGILTIGYGRNVEVRGLSEVEALFLLDNDIDVAIEDLTREWPPFVGLDAVRRVVIADLYFNMRLGRPQTFVGEFRPTLDLVESGHYEAAAARMRGWKWYRDVGPRRADPLIAMMRSGIASLP